MAIEKVQEILQKLSSDPKAQELFKAIKLPDNDEEKALKMIEVAKQLGYDLKTEDLLEYLSKASAARKEKTEAQAEAVQKLDESELEKAAGGKGHNNCKDTYLDRENCWGNDACDLLVNMYSDYICEHNHGSKACGVLESMNCKKVVI